MSDATIDATKLTDIELDEMVAALVDEQRRRARESGDLPTLADDGFESMFDGRGAAGGPVIQDRLLLCPGSVVPKSKTIHLSRFVAVGDEWVWERGDLLYDEIRRGEGAAMRSISIVPLVEGLEYHVIHSKGPAGGRRLEQAVSYRIRHGVEEQITTRVPALSERR